MIIFLGRKCLIFNCLEMIFFETNRQNMALRHELKKKLKTYFIAGLLVVGPMGLTIIVVQRGGRLAGRAALQCLAPGPEPGQSDRT
jgi:hypothetical protein